jgi:hypothetical protein
MLTIVLIVIISTSSMILASVFFNFGSILILLQANVNQEGMLNNSGRLTNQSGLTMVNQSTSTATQQTTSGNFTKLIEEKFTKTPAFGIEILPDVRVVSESPKTLVLFGELITPPGNYNVDLWTATDLLKNDYGFKLTHIIKDGEGTQANPEEYISLWNVHSLIFLLCQKKYV